MFHEPIKAFSTLVRPTLAAADIRLAQCERLYSLRGSLQLHSGVTDKPLEPHMASVFTDCGFDVVSVASNHAMDWGPDALLDTIALFREKGIQPIGGGHNIEEACQAAIIDRNGVRVAILAFCSVLREGYAAGPDKPGVAPMRAHTYYEAEDYQPGVPPRVVTILDEEDLATMVRHIEAARNNADVVVLSLHWGIHFIPRTIADYQPVVAQAGFKAGADIIVGHHAHVPKAVGVHDGKVCFYSLSNFIMSSRWLSGDPKKPAAFEKKYGVSLDPDYRRLPYGTDGKRSLIAKAVLSREGVEQVSFLPVLIDKQLRPEVLKRGDSRFDDAVKFMEWVSEDFEHNFTNRRERSSSHGSARVSAMRSCPRCRKPACRIRSAELVPFRRADKAAQRSLRVNEEIMRILSMAESSKPLLKLGMQSWICTPEASVRTSTQSMTSGARLAWQSGIAGSRDREPDVMHLYYPSRRQPSAAFTLVVGCRTPP